MGYEAVSKVMPAMVIFIIALYVQTKIMFKRSGKKSSGGYVIRHIPMYIIETLVFIFFCIAAAK